ncbi:MAG: MoxR family ATPase [Planctomycetota bacterium]|nr:MAG: MoxR family ATPase [Planctomycetota bacterium]
MQDSSSPEAAIARLRACYEALRANISKVVVGQDEAVRLLATAMVCGGHVLMVGVPGLAKTLMVKTLAKSLGWQFNRVQFTPDLMPSDITGTELLQTTPDGERRLVFHQGPIFANLVLADEINRTPPKTQAALLEAMQERMVTVSGQTYPLPAPFVVVATQNPIEQEGTYPLPEAQLDRFLLSVHLDYPSREQEIDIAAMPTRMKIPELPAVAGADDFLGFADIVDQVPVARPVLAYAVALVTATRPADDSADAFVRKYVHWGAGPRCSQFLITAARAVALLDGRPSPEVRDVQDVALAVMRHRIVPNYNALGEGLESKDIIAHLLKQVGQPAAV